MQGNGKRTNAPLFSRWSSGLLHTCRERKGKRMHRRWMSLAVVAVALVAGAGSATATPSGVGAFGASSAAGRSTRRRGQWEHRRAARLVCHFRRQGPLDRHLDEGAAQRPHVPARSAPLRGPRRPDGERRPGGGIDPGSARGARRSMEFQSQAGAAVVQAACRDRKMSMRRDE